MEKKEEKVYIVTYNDCYGVSGNNDKKMEVALEKKGDFRKWLKEHNAERRGLGAKSEGPEEFDVESYKVVTFDKQESKLKSVCVVTYAASDNYGNVSNSIEDVIDSYKNFSKWLKKHNAGRKANGDITEKAHEFSLKTLKIENFK